MRKFFALPLAFVAVAAIAAQNPVMDLNAEIAKLLAPFQNNVTSASFSFSRIETNAERALGVALSMFYKKTGPQNILEVNLPNLSYEYGDGSAPTTRANGNVKLDLTKLIPQEDINQLVPELENIIMESVKELTDEYGSAVTVTATVNEKNRDGNGNYTSIRGTVSFAFDYSKLPQNIKVEDIPVKNGSVTIGLDVNSGLAFDLTIVSNPGYKGFQQDQLGLKEVLDALLARNPEVMEQLGSFIQQLDSLAGELVNQK